MFSSQSKPKPIKTITQQNKNDLINIFVDFYGEKYRQFITERINSTQFIFGSQVSDEMLENFDVDQRMKASFVEGVSDFKSGRMLAQAYCQGYLDNAGKFQTCVVLGDNFDDHQLLHELNHILAMGITKMTDNEFQFFSAFDFIEDGFAEEEPENRKYSAFNEVVNETITRKLMESRNRLGVVISPIEHQESGYLLGERMSKSFVDYFMPDIVDCVINRQPENFREIIGDEMFESVTSDLSQIMGYNSFEIFHLCDDISRKTGIQINKVSDIIKNADALLKFDLTDEEKAFIQVNSRFVRLTEQAVENDREKKYY